MIKKIKVFSLVAIGVFVFQSCGSKKGMSDNAKTAKTETCNEAITYNLNVKAIIDNNCGKTCHSAEKHAAGIDLSTYDKVKKEAENGRFLGAIKHQGYYAPMPMKNPKLSDSTISIIECWIKNGSKQ
ncbi:MAG: hypothetical protein R2852_02165 [Bacteroidia bacterium]